MEVAVNETSTTQPLRDSEIYQEPLIPSSWPNFDHQGTVIYNFLASIGVMAKCSEQSRSLLKLLREKLSVKQASLSPEPSESSDIRLFDCSYCNGFMAQPVCLPCGHSLCEACLSKATKASNAACPDCNEPIILNRFERKPTVMLKNALSNYYPAWIQACQLREEGNRHANQGDFQRAIEYYNKAVSKDVCDHRVYGNRSRSFLAVMELDRALMDAQTACRIRPLWNKGHFRRACALENKGLWMEAVAAYLLCLHLSDKDDYSIISKLCQLLDGNLSEFTHYERSIASTHSKYPTSGLKLSTAGLSTDTSLTPTLDAIIELCQAAIGLSHKPQVPGPVEMDPNDFECSLCAGLIHEPITVTCGHSFCRTCLSRAFDHSQTCPICRSVLYELFQAYSQKSGHLSVDATLEALINHQFPTQSLEKKAQREAESLRNFRVGTCSSEPLPIFVCTQALPGIPCPLHVFEPRYRLMIRRCMENGGRRFGMCQPALTDSNEHSFSDFGTVLYINSVEYTPDGRSLVKSIGERRFKVVGKDMLDGYHRALVEFVFDERVVEQAEIDALRAQQAEVYSFAKSWLDALPATIKVLMIQSACSPLPPIEKLPEICPNGPMWVWWYIHTLPLSPQQKQDMYMCTSLKDRLSMLQSALLVK